MNSHFKFLRRVRIHGGECGAVARALHHKAQKAALTQNEQSLISDESPFLRQADLGKALGSTFIERKQMSTKTTLKRIALVAVSALSFGLLTVVSVTPASAVATTLAATVGPNGETSLTIVGDTATGGAVVKIDVTTNDTNSTTAAIGLSAGETVTATVIGVPTGVTAKTLAANGGSMADTSTQTSGDSDFSIIETKPATSGTTGLTVLDATSRPSAWGTPASKTDSTNHDSATAAGRGSETNNSVVTDGQIGSMNQGNINMDKTKQLQTGLYTKSYYVTILPRTGAVVQDQGAYTFQFQLTDAGGVVRSTKTVKIDWVSTAAKSDAAITLATSGTFLTAASLLPYDTAAATYATLTLKNRDGGLIRLNTGAAPAPTATIQWIRTGQVTTDTVQLTELDNGTYGSDFGRDSSTSPGTGTLRAFDGVYGLTGTLPATISATGNTYQLWAGYGNATIQTKAITLVTTTGTAVAANTDVLVTAAGMSSTDQNASLNSATHTRTLPTTTKSATVKVTMQSGSTNIGAADITVTPTWGGAYGTASVTPVTSTTGTVYTTDAEGTFTVTVTNATPIDGANIALVLSGGTALGSGEVTITLTWKDPVASSIEVVDPISTVVVKTASTNVTTVIVKDQFGNAVANQGVSVGLAVTPAPAVASTTVISPLTTGANGTATYSNTGGAAITKDTLTFACVPTACGSSAIMVYNYAATVPAVATLTAYFDRTLATSGATLVPSTGIYQSGTTTPLTLTSARNLSKDLGSFADTTTDDFINLRFYGLDATSLAAEGAVVTVTAGDGGHILDALGLPVKTRNFLVLSTGYTGPIKVLATKTGAITFTATSGASTVSASMWVANATADARFITVTSAATGTANGTGTPVTVNVTDRYGNAVSGVALNVVASGVGSFMGGGITTSFTTDASGSYTFLANSLVDAGGVGTFTVSSGTTSSMTAKAGYVGATEVDATLAAGNSSATKSITFAAGRNAATLAAEAATAAAEAAADAAAEAIDAANAATDAANLSAEAADAATVAAEEARDAADAATAAVEELATQVATLMAALKAQITTLANTVAKIAKKVKA
jgi:hypothetical protein